MVKGYVNLSNRCLKGDVIAAISYLKGYYTEEEVDLVCFFLNVSEGRTKTNGLKLQGKRVRLDINRNFLII